MWEALDTKRKEEPFIPHQGKVGTLLSPSLSEIDGSVCLASKTLYRDDLTSKF